MARKLVIVFMLLAALALPAGCAEADDPDTVPGDGLHSVVPNVVDMPYDEARAELENAGFELGEIIPEGARGTVVEQDPRGGYSAPNGSAINLTLTEQ